MLSGSRDATVRLWSLDSKEALRTLQGHTHQVNAVGVLPSGQVASGSLDGTLKVWKGEEAVHSVKAHETSVLCLLALQGGDILTGACTRFPCSPCTRSARLSAATRATGRGVALCSDPCEKVWVQYLIVTLFYVLHLCRLWGPDYQAVAGRTLGRHVHGPLGLCAQLVRAARHRLCFRVA